MTAADAAARFERLLAAGLAAGPRGNKTFEQIGAYLRALSQPDYATACLQRYLAVYRKYENDANRSRGDAAFYQALKRVLDLAKPAELDTWYDEITSARQPRSPLKQRFDALGKADQDQLLQFAKAPRQAHKEAASVLTELREAFQSVKKRPPANDGELLTFDPLPNDSQFRQEYEFWLGLLQRSYDAAVYGKFALPGLDLTAQCQAFWSFVHAPRQSGLRLFQLLAYWRRDRTGPRGSQSVGSYVDQIAYVQIAAALLSYALETKAYAANVRQQSFTVDEWNFVLAPLLRRSRYQDLLYGDTYDNLLRAFPAHAGTFAKQCELFLRLVAFATEKGISLATNAEMKRVATARAARAREVIAKIQAGSIESDRAPSFVVSARESGALVASGTYSVGIEIAETFRIAHFEGTPAQQIYVEFHDIPCALFTMSRSVFIHFARDAVFELVFKYTAPLLTLIPLLFQVLLAIPGVVDGGFIGLVRALLSPVEMEAASSALDQFGLDGDQAGWWLLAAGLLTHQVRGRASGLKTRGLEDPAIERRGTQSAADELAASRRAEISDEGVGAAGREAAVTHADPAVEPEDVAAAGRRDQPVIPTPRFPASENTMIRGTAAAANENRLAGPGIAELEAFAADAQAANLIASEIAELEWQLAQQEAEELAQQEGAELSERAVASGRGGGRGNTGSSAGARGTTFSGRGTGGPRPGAKPPATPSGSGRTVLDTTKAKIRGLDAKTRQWLEDIAAEWRKQCARFKKVPGLNASQRGIKAHAATQRAMKELHPGTVIEEPTGVGSSGVPRRSDLAQGPGGGQAAVAELKPWGYRLPGSGRLATSRDAIESGVETLQLQAYGVLDRELGRPVFVFTANGNVWTPAPGGRWTLVGKAK